MTETRTGIVTFKGGPMTLVGPELKVGDAAPDFHLLDGAMAEVNLASSAGKTRILVVVPSLDTPVCAIETKKFNEEAANLPDNVIVYVISVDLPFAQSRFCGAENTDKIVALSDYKDRSFGEAYGVLMDELKLHARAIFVVGPDDKIKYIQIVPEIADEPNYAEVLDAVK